MIDRNTGLETIPSSTSPTISSMEVSSPRPSSAQSRLPPTVSPPAAAALPVSFVLTGTARNGTDYFGVALSANIAAGFSNTTVTILPFLDTPAEGDQTVIHTLTPASHYLVGGADSATVSIVDDNSPGNAFEEWALANSVVGVGGDEDMDGYRKLIEFALGTDPNETDPPGLIHGELLTVNQQRFLALVVNRQMKSTSAPAHAGGYLGL